MDFAVCNLTHFANFRMSRFFVLSGFASNPVVGGHFLLRVGCGFIVSVRERPPYGYSEGVSHVTIHRNSHMTNGRVEVVTPVQR